MRCFQCNAPISQEEHDQHVALLYAIGDWEPDGSDNLFVHCIGSEDNFDEEGFVVVCDRHFVAEIAGELATAHLMVIRQDREDKLRLGSAPQL